MIQQREISTTRKKKDRQSETLSAENTKTNYGQYS